MINAEIMTNFLFVLLIFCSIVLFGLKRENKRLRIKNKKLKNIVNTYYGKYGYFSDMENNIKKSELEEISNTLQELYNEELDKIIKKFNLIYEKFMK